MRDDTTSSRWRLIAHSLSLAIAISPAASAAGAPDDPGQRVLHTERSLYRNILVYEEAGVRCMRFGRLSGSRQTCMTMAEPERMVFDYTKMILGALYLNPEPARILVIGLGGGTLPTALAQLLPRASIDAVEIDPAVTRVARAFFGYTPTQRSRVFEEDGRVFVKRAARRGEHYDLVILDAFDHDYIPEHLLTREFLAEVRQLLPEGGVLAANTFSGGGLYNHESATYASVFGTFLSVERTNRVILARIGGLPDAATLVRNARALEPSLRRYGVMSDELLPLMQPARQAPAGSRVLTDQYSPSNLLNSKR